MKKTFIILFFICSFLSIQAQRHYSKGHGGKTFRTGLLLGVGVSPKGDVNPLDTMQAVANIGVIEEINLGWVYFRTGLLYENPKSAMIPLYVCFKTSDYGGFMGFGAHYDITQNQKPGYTIFLGNRIWSNIDLGLYYEHPFEGTIKDVDFSIKLTIFPKRQCEGACSWIRGN